MNNQQARGIILAEVDRYFVGPGTSDEVIEDNPWDFYHTAMLWPVGEMIGPDEDDQDNATGMADDAKSQLRFAATNGFLTAALFAIVRLVLSDYSRVRRAAGFSTYRPAEILTVLDNAGFAGGRLPSNVGPTTHRFSVMGRRMADPQQEYGAAAGQ